MASNINPNNIDGAYPVAGQDNNSQGFRDNFTNIKLNFQYAEDEINDLQSKVLLKSPLDGQATLNNNMNDQLIYAAQIRDFSATKVSITQTSGSIAIDYAQGHFQTISTTGSISLSFTNWPPATGLWGWVRVQITITNTAHTVTLPSAVNIGTSYLQGYNSSTRAITFGQIGTYTFEFSSGNAGASVTVQDLSRNLDPIFLPSSQNLSAGGATSLATTASYFAPVSSQTSTLADGAEGQMKTYMMTSYTGYNMVVTVASPGWGGAGTITFGATGRGCTLQFIQGKWYCVGNNAAVFA